MLAMSVLASSFACIASLLAYQKSSRNIRVTAKGFIGVFDILKLLTLGLMERDTKSNQPQPKWSPDFLSGMEGVQVVTPDQLPDDIREMLQEALNPKAEKFSVDSDNKISTAEMRDLFGGDGLPPEAAQILFDPRNSDLSVREMRAKLKAIADSLSAKADVKH
jgi:hypothetical protein